ncbi:MAG: hypothetical protein Kow00109_09440 [Acidobacteriota bacterium]
MKKLAVIPITGLLLLAGWGGALAQNTPAATPAELVRSYETLADVILGAKQTEKNLVAAILATTYGHAQGALAQAKADIAAGRDARASLERLAAFVSQLGNEGDAAVAGVRKRLLEGGHHHNAKGEEQGIYDEGFVIVTKAAKKVFLDAATEIGKLVRSPDAAALDKIWNKVDKEYKSLLGQ